MNQIVLNVENVDWVPPQPAWDAVFAHHERITVTDVQRNDADAALIPISCCERFGCQTGAPRAPLGTMYVYDAHAFEAPNPYFPRFLISNALWRPEPASLDEQIDRRIRVLAETIQRFNEASAPIIQSVNIDCSVLGNWIAYPMATRIEAIRTCEAAIRSHFGL